MKPLTGDQMKRTLNKMTDYMGLNIVGNNWAK